MSNRSKDEVANAIFQLLGALLVIAVAVCGVPWLLGTLLAWAWNDVLIGILHAQVVPLTFWGALSVIAALVVVGWIFRWVFRR